MAQRALNLARLCAYVSGSSRGKSLDKNDERAGRLLVAKLRDPKETVTRDTLEVELPSDDRTHRVHALHVIDGGHAGKIFVLAESEAVAGRGESCALSLGDPGVSRAHASFVLSAIGVQVTDLGSRNGTFVNGRRVVDAVLLRQGDTISLGGVRLRYGLEADEQVRRLRDLHEAAVHDHLTGLYNRRFFEERLLAEVAYAVRHRALLSLIMFDVDRFKDLNDTHGHIAGDTALKAIAKVLQGGVRTEDVVARYGGEELVVVARGAGLEGALALGERLRARVEALRLDHESRNMRVTVSAGVAALSDNIVNARQLVRAADGALFDAKERGRNRVVAASLEAPIARTGEMEAVRLASGHPQDDEESA